MASTIAGVTVKAKAEGLNEINKTAGEINQNLAAAQKSATKLSNTKFAAAAAKRESDDYGVTRSLRPGGTGASARDFAQEAQGLGGLVRLYATYAANIFAVGAAFRALSNAMDTTNMVRGLDQLGAASGMALGSLSKRLVVATDGAISLREAMESVAKASSSGMSSENILRMGKVAKQASQALGVDMANAVDRITRGITKLEPELLDEIGIFTRVDSAVKEYAKSTGKAVSSLTDFERRMAFANAVLEEGERKFSAIEIDTNPYTKLTAAIKNAAQEGLELANKVLVPIVNLLSESPTALTAVLGTLGLLLVRQALPAIGEFKAGLESAAQQATSTALKRAQDADAAKQKLSKAELLRIEEMAEMELDALANAEATYKALDKSRVEGSKKVKALLKKDIADIEEAELASAEKTALARSNKNPESKALKAAELDIINSIRNVQAAEEKYAAKSVENQQTIAKNASAWGTYGQTVRLAVKAQESATKAQIVSTAAYNGSLVGFSDAFSLMREDIAKSNLQLSAFSKATLMARGGVAILGGAISTLGATLSGAFMWIGLITGAIAVFDSLFSKASKQIAEFSSNVDSLEQASGNLTRTLDTINSNNPFSVKSLEAQGTAMMEFSSSVDALEKSANKAISALKNSAWDSFKDRIKSIWGGDIQGTFTDSLATAISTAVEDLENSPIQTKLKDNLGALLNVKDVSNFEELKKALQGIAPGSEMAKKLGKELKQAGIEASNTASKAREFADAFKKSEESFKNFTKQFDNKDPLVQYATDSIRALGELTASISGPLSGSLDNLKTLLNGLNENPIFGIEKSQELAQYANEMDGINKTIVEQTNKVHELTKAREEQEKTLAAIQLRNANINSQRSAYDSMNQGRRDGRAATRTTTGNLPDVEKQRALLESTNKALVRAQDNIATATSKGNAIAERIATEIPNGITRGKDLLITALDASLAKGANAFKSSIISSFGNLPGFAKAEANVQIGEIGIEKKLLEVQFQMLREQVQIKLNTAKSALLAERLDLEKAASSTTSEQRRNSIQEKLNTNIQDTDAISNAISSVKVGKSYKDALSGLEKLDEKSRELLTGYAISVAGLTAKLQQLGQQELSIRFQAEVKEIQAKANQAQQILDTDTKTLQLSKEQLALRKDLTAEERLALETSLNKDTILNATLKEQATAAFAYAEISAKIVAYESLKTKTADDLLALDAAKTEQARLYNAIVQAGIKGQVAGATEDEAAKKRSLELTLKRETQLANIARIEEGIAQNSKEVGLSVEEQRLNVLQEILGSESRAYTILQTTLTAQRDQLDVERQIAEVKAQSSDRLRSLRSEALNTDTDTTRAAQIKEEIAQEERRAALQISNIQAVASARTAATAAIQSQNTLLAEQNEILASTESFANNLASAFDGVGEALGGAILGLQNFINAQQQSAQKQAAISESIDKAFSEGRIMDAVQLQKQYDKEVQKSKERELDGIIDIVGSTKKMFKEKTAGYKILNAAEKAASAVRLVLQAKELAANIAANASKVASDTPAIMSEFFKQLGPWGWAAGAAAIAAIGGSFSGGGGTPVGMTAEEQQNVQGTGQDYINGQLVANGGGVLGDITATSKDISDSLSLIEENTTSQILFDSKAVDYLRAIRTNTEGLAAAISSVPGITGGISGFGTREKSNPGFLGLFASSTSIIDSGIRAAGTLGEILKDPAAYFKQYETVQKTKSGFLGIGGGTSIKVNTKPLEQEITEYIIGIFENAKKTVVELGTVFGLDTTKAVDDLVNSLSVDFQVSAKGLKGDELIEAIMAETGVTMNQLVAQVYPFLEDFQKVGEGMLTTLTRVNTEIQVVNGLFDQMGVDFAKKFTPGMNVLSNAATAAAKQATADAKARLEAAKTASATESGYIDVIEIRGDVETTYRKQILETEAEKQELIDATNAYNAALKAENNAKYASIRASVAVYDALVESEGGLDRFTERANFFIDNFVPSSVKLGSALNTVETGMDKLGYSGVKTREEFYKVVTGLDLSTEAGRATYSSLMDLAPAFDIIADKVDELAGSVKLSTESLATIIVDGYMNGIDGAQIGKMVANTIQRGVQQALIQGVANQIAGLITAQIVNPMLQSIIAGGVVSASVSKATMTSVVAQANAMLSALAEVFSSPEFQQFLADLGNLNFNFANIDVTPAYQYEQTNSNDAAEDARKEALAAVDAAFNALKKAVDAEKKLIQDQIKLAEENLNKLNQLIDVLDSNIKDLRSSVDSTAAMQAAQGQQFITDALAAAISTGVLPDADKLEEAIGAVRAGIDKGNFESKFAEDRAKLILAGELQRLKDLGLEQKTDAELQLEALNAQIDALDAILENAQAQIDALKGIDTSVLTVSEALAKLAAAIAGTPGGGGGSNPPPGGQNPGIGGRPGIGGDLVANKGFSGALTKDYQGVYNLGSVRQQDGKYYYTSTVTDAGGFAGVQSPSDTLTSSKPWTTVGYAANNPDVVQYYNQNKALIAQLGQAANLADYLNYHFITYGISENRKFAKGGIFDNAIISAPTLFDTGLMGEAGPEAIMPLGKMPDGSLGVRGNTGDNSELVAEIRTLRAELTHMKQYVAKTSTSTEESRKLLDEVVRGGSAITVESEIATY